MHKEAVTEKTKTIIANQIKEKKAYGILSVSSKCLWKATSPLIKYSQVSRAETDLAEKQKTLRLG